MKEEAALKRTPLYSEYQKYGAKVIDFGGWAMPVQFTGILHEHEAVRTKAGLFDVSHMGEILVEGTEAEDYINGLLTNDVSKLSVNKAQYTAMCYEDGGTVDDLLVYKLGNERFLLVINAANIEKDYEWMKEHVQGEVMVKNVSSGIAQLAVQGPKAEAILQKLTETDLSQIGFFQFEQDVHLAGIPNILVSRTGYTGEDGFELYLASDQAAALWEEVIKAGEPDGLVLCGLGARDTLRLESRLPLYGQELTSDISPLEAGIGFAVKTNKDTPFIGQEVLKKQKEEGVKRKIAGIEIIGKGIPRTGYHIFSEAGEKIGMITSGTHSPSLKKPLGLGLIAAEQAGIGTKLKVEIRHKMMAAVVVKTPFYPKE
ncbi:glycine cleavage system protein T [Domibacillus antri]|uniref:Aminomethyltransferase n=1 Tax=Domibacillus antri TaxID=1714264 RepID=A0A1Q8Q6M5_9BACI|nr:glycine cleavage system aminomethyltransferase GcvT [Domibacillus antri]OLN22993.1 glycine cleavage system protein T [Domibacillus antri]